MTEEITTSAPAAETVAAPTPNRMEMQIETNSAPTEQRSVEMVTTEPKTVEATEPVTPTEPTEPVARSSEDVRRAIEAEIRAENAERQVRELQPKPKQFGAEPDIGSYSTIDEWKADLKAYYKQVNDAEFTSNQAAQKQQAEAAKIRADIQLRAVESRKKHPDFDQKVKPLANVMGSIPILNDFMAKNPMGLEVAYHLADQPALLETLRTQDMWTAGEALLSMAARLKNPAPIQVSNAPEPIRPVGSRETAPVNLAQLAARDINGYMHKMNKMESDRKRRAN